MKIADYMSVQKTQKSLIDREVAISSQTVACVRRLTSAV